MSYQSILKSPDRDALITKLTCVHDHWCHIQNDQEMPSWREWDWLEVSVDIIPWCAVVDVIGDGEDFRHRFWGTARRELFDADYTGKLVSEMRPEAVAVKSWDELAKTYERRAPVHIMTEDYDFGGHLTRYHMLRLPFGDNGQVTHILSAVVFDREDMKVVHDFMTQAPSTQLFEMH